MTLDQSNAIFLGMRKRKRLLAAIGSVVILAASLGVGWHYLRQRKTAELLLQAADEAERNSDWDQVEAALRSYLAVESENGDVCRRIGEAIECSAQSEVDRKRAIPFFAKAVRADPKNVTNRIALARVLRFEQPEQAIVHARYVLDQQPQHEEACRLRLIAEVTLMKSQGESKREPSLVWKELNELADGRPTDIELIGTLAEFSERYLIASGRMEMDQIERIRRGVDLRFEKLIEGNQDAAAARLARLTFETRFRRSDESSLRQDVEMLAVLQPKDLTVQLMAAGMNVGDAFHRAPWMDRGQTPDTKQLRVAQSHLREASKLETHNPVTHWSLAQLDVWNGEYQQAIQNLKNGLRQDRNGNVVLLIRLAELQLSTGRWSECRSTLQQLAALLRTGDGRNAIRGLSGSASLSEADDELGGLSSVIQVLNVQWFLAVDNPEWNPRNAIELLNDDTESRTGAGIRSLRAYLRGIAYVQIGEWNQAEKCFDRCLTITADIPLVLAARAFVLCQQGRYREASITYRQCIDGSEGNDARLNQKQIWIEILRCELASNALQIEVERDWRITLESIQKLKALDEESLLIDLIRAEAELLGCESLGHHDLQDISIRLATSENTSAVSFTMLARQAMRLGKPEIARRAIQQVESLSGGQNFALRCDLAVCESDVAQVAELLTNVPSTLNRRDHRMHVLKLTRFLSLKGQIGTARRELERWCTTYPNDVEALYRLAECHWSAGQQEGLRRVRNELKRIDENGVHWRLCDVQQLLLDYAAGLSSDLLSEIQDTMNRLQGSFPNDRRVLVLRAFVAELSGARQIAIQCYRRAVELGEQEANIMLRFAVALSAEGQSREALRICRKLLDRAPRKRVLIEAAGVMTSGPVDQNDADVFELEFERALAVPFNEQDILLLINVSILREHQGNPEEAIRVAKLALKLKPSSSVLRNNLAWLLSAYAEDHSAAIELLSPLFDRQPNSAFCDTMAVALIGQGDGENAREILERASPETQRTASRWLHMAEASFLCEDLEAARGALLEAENMGLERMTPRDRKAYATLKFNLPVGRGVKTEEQ